jgi:hypothetical protein
VAAWQGFAVQLRESMLEQGMARHSAKDPTTLGCSSIAASCVGMVAMGSGACTGPCNGGANAGVDVLVAYAEVRLPNQGRR